MLYKKLNVPNFEILKDELLELIRPEISQNLRFWTLSVASVYKQAPNLSNFIFKNFIKAPVLIRCYNTPPFSGLVPHIDNVKNARNQVALNIPLYGTQNTSMDYYSTEEDNLFLTYTDGKANLPVQVIKDQNKLVLIDSIELDIPALVRTDVIHGIRNDNSTYRLIASFKFLGSSFEEVYKGPYINKP